MSHYKIAWPPCLLSTLWRNARWGVPTSEVWPHSMALANDDAKLHKIIDCRSAGTFAQVMAAILEGYSPAPAHDFEQMVTEPQAQGGFWVTEADMDSIYNESFGFSPFDGFPAQPKFTWDI